MILTVFVGIAGFERELITSTACGQAGTGAADGGQGTESSAE